MHILDKQTYTMKDQNKIKILKPHFPDFGPTFRTSQMDMQVCGTWDRSIHTRELEPFKNIVF